MSVLVWQWMYCICQISIRSFWPCSTCNRTYQILILVLLISKELMICLVSPMPCSQSLLQNEKWLWFSCKLNYCLIGIYTNIYVLIICPYCKEYYRHCITTFLELLQKSTLTAVPFYVQMRIKKCTIIGFDVLTQVNELDNRSWF